MGRVLLALAEDRDEAAVPALEWPRDVNEFGVPVGPRFVDAGLAQGYVPARLRGLADLASVALRHDRKIVWG